MKEHIAVAEANRLGITVFGIVDTNSNPNGVDYVIPANDDATKSIELIVAEMVNALKEGANERKLERAEEESEQVEVKQPRTRTRKGTRKEAPKAEKAEKAEKASENE